MIRFSNLLCSLFISFFLFSCTDYEIYEEKYYYENNFQYFLDNENVVIHKYLGDDAIIYVPNKLGGHTVNRVSSYAFSNNQSVKEVVFPNSEMLIGNGVFKNCTNLESLILPSSIKNIPYSSFKNCVNLEKVIIPEGVVEINDDAFYNCSALTHITLPNTLSAIGKAAFYACGLEEVVLPPFIKSIGSLSFSSCQNLIKLNIPSSVENIGEAAFVNNDNLSVIDVSLDNSVYRFEDGALFNTERKSLHTYLVSNIQSDYTIPNYINEIEDFAFWNNDFLHTVVIPASVIQIKDGAFGWCSNLQKITIPSSVTYIGHGAFSACESLDAVTFSTSFATLGKNVFSGTNTVILEVEGNTALHNYALANKIPFKLFK